MTIQQVVFVCCKWRTIIRNGIRTLPWMSSDTPAVVVQVQLETALAKSGTTGIELDNEWRKGNRDRRFRFSSSVNGMVTYLCVSHTSGVIWQSPASLRPKLSFELSSVIQSNRNWLLSHKFTKPQSQLFACSIDLCIWNFMTFFFLERAFVCQNYKYKNTNLQTKWYK